MSQPNETYTFLFTDIEGSTRLWETQYEAMKSALSRHDALLRVAIESHGGHVFKTGGDAFYALFATATDALAAALAGQQALLTEPWGEVTLKVRMALVTGPAEMREGDYFGPPLNRTARLLGIGHGSQILLARSTQIAVQAALPPDVTLQDMGQHHLKDLEQPEQVFQVMAPFLPAEFPSLRSLSTHPTNLPAPATRFIRRAEVGTLRSTLTRPAVRLLTLTGPGGTGKSRLGLEVASALLPAFPDGVFWVPLAPIQDPLLVVPAIAQVLGVQEADNLSLLERLKGYLRPKQLLLLLDNFEQILDAAPIISELLGAAPQLKVLVTSREILYLYGEQEFPVPPLTLPNGSGKTADALLASEAGQLFVDRVQALRPDFALTAQDAPAIAEICTRLEGLPLALELAAARVRWLSLDQIVAQLAHRLELLASGPRDLPARQRTLRGAIAWSHELLNSEEQTLFRRLAPFAGGCTASAVAALYPAPVPTLADALEALGHKSLLAVSHNEEGPRYHMLETIREFAVEQLEASQEDRRVRHQHASYVCSLVEETMPHFAGQTSAPGLLRLEREHDNIRAALMWSLTAPDGEPEVGGRIVGNLGPFWIAKGHLTEGRRWLEMALAKRDALSGAVRAHVLRTAGEMEDLERDGTMARAEGLLLESLALYGDLRDERGMAQTLFALGHIYRRQDQLHHAAETYHQALEQYRLANETWGVARTFKELGRIAGAHGDFAQAQSFYEQSAQSFKELGDTAELSHLYQLLGDSTFYANQEEYGRAIAYYQRGLTLARALQHRYRIMTLINSLGELYRFRQAYEQALPYFEEGLRLAREEGTKSIAALLANRGYIALHQNQPEVALAMFRESLAISEKSGIRRFFMYSLLTFAVASAGLRQYERSVRLLAFVEGIRSTLQHPLEPPDRAEYEQALALARTHLSPSTFDDAWATGQTMSAEQAMVEARALKVPSY